MTGKCYAKSPIKLEYFIVNRVNIPNLHDTNALCEFIKGSHSTFYNSHREDAKTPLQLESYSEYYSRGKTIDIHWGDYIVKCSCFNFCGIIGVFSEKEFYKLFSIDETEKGSS